MFSSVKVKIKEVKVGGLSFPEAVKRGPPKRFVVCSECTLTKQIAKGNICARCQDELKREKERRKQ